MYNVYQGNKKIKSKFSTYEAARQFVRKQLRKITPYRSNNQPDLPMFMADFNIVRI